MKTTFIYALLDPRDGKIRYVGKANDTARRLKAHVNPARYKPTHKFNWLKSLRNLSLKPVMVTLEECPTSVWKHREKYWIRYFYKRGYNLTNYTSGGDGLSFGNSTSFKKGHKSWNKGKGRIQTCEICKKSFKNINKNKTCSKDCETKYRKLHLSSTTFKKGGKAWNKGKTGYKLGGKKTSKVVLQLTLEGVLVKEHLGTKEAAVAMDCTLENIANACRGVNKTAKGYKWKYK